MHPRAPASIRNRSAGDLAPTRAPDFASARYHPCPPVNAAPSTSRVHARSPAPTAPRTSTRLPTAPSPPCSLTARATTGTTSRRSRTTRFPRARTTSGRRLSTTTSRSTSSAAPRHHRPRRPPRQCTTCLSASGARALARTSLLHLRFRAYASTDASAGGVLKLRCPHRTPLAVYSTV